jgi:hypothetical protein
MRYGINAVTIGRDIKPVQANSEQTLGALQFLLGIRQLVTEDIALPSQGNIEVLQRILSQCMDVHSMNATLSW